MVTVVTCSSCLSPDHRVVSATLKLTCSLLYQYHLTHSLYSAVHHCAPLYRTVPPPCAREPGSGCRWIVILCTGSGSSPLLILITKNYTNLLPLISSYNHTHLFVNTHEEKKSLPEVLSVFLSRKILIPSGCNVHFNPNKLTIVLF